MKATLRIASLVALLFSAATIFAQSSYFSTAGGSLTAGTTKGSSVTFSNQYANVSCTVQFFGTATYSRNWHCGGGSVWADTDYGIIQGTVDPNPGYLNMVYVCGGGGRGNRGHCSYQMYAQVGYYYTVQPTTFHGTLTDADGNVTNISGTVVMAAGSASYPGLGPGINASLTLEWQ